MSNTGYHTRLYQDNGVKVCGGSFGGDLSMATANRLTDSFFNVIVKESGHTVFIDRQGREVTLYLTVDAAATIKGAAAQRVWRANRSRLFTEQKEELEVLMEGLSHEEIVKRLRPDLILEKHDPKTNAPSRHY